MKMADKLFWAIMRDAIENADCSKSVFPANRQNRLVTEVPSKAGIVYLLERDGFVSWFLCL